MKSTITLTDEVTVGTVEDLRLVSDTLEALVVKAENFALDGKVEYLRVEIKTDYEEYRCKYRGLHTHTDQCERKKQPERTYAQLVVKVTSGE